MIIHHSTGNFHRAGQDNAGAARTLDNAGAALYLSAMTRDEQWDEEIDAIGLLCPLPVLKARKRLKTMAARSVLRLVTTDPAARIDVAHFCAETGHELLGAGTEGEATAWLIRKRP